MRKWGLFFWLVGALPAFSQTLPSRTLPAVDTAQLGPITRFGQHMHLPALAGLTDQRHLRVFSAGYVLDCGQTGRDVYQGQVVHWVREIVPEKEPATNRQFVLSQPLPAATVRALFALLDSAQMLAVPDARTISGWRPMLDGVAYTLEYRDAQTHCVRTYDNPEAQGALPEAQLITCFLHRLDALTHQPELPQRFVRAIPYQCYTDDGGSTTCRVVPHAAQVTYRRERRRYRQQQAR